MAFALLASLLVNVSCGFKKGSIFTETPFSTRSCTTKPLSARTISPAVRWCNNPDCCAIH